MPPGSRSSLYGAARALGLERDPFEIGLELVFDSQR
jgi:hypothetical protein